jgi:tetratricopeptide (TPR) repeat protein
MNRRPFIPYTVRSHILYGCVVTMIGFVFSLCGTVVAFSQQGPHIDSLRSVFHDRSLPDTTRLQSLFSLCKSMVDIYPDSTDFYAQKGLTLSMQLKQPAYTSRFLRALGTIANTNGTVTAAESYLKRSVKIADSLRIPVLQAQSIRSLGGFYNERSEYARSVDCFLRGLLLAEQTTDKQLIMELKGGLGNAYLGLESYDLAHDYYTQALKIGEAEGDSMNIIMYLNNLALVHTAQNKHGEALQSLTRALLMAKAAGQQWMLGNLYMNIGDSYAQLKESNLAIEHYRLAMMEHKKSKNKLGEAQVNYRLAEVYQYQAPDSTLIFGRRALETAKAMSKKNLLANTARLLSDTYAATGRYQPALEMYQLYHLTQDSIYNKEQIASISKSEARFEFEIKELQNKAEQEKLRAKQALRARTIYLLMGSLFIFLVLAGLYIMRQRNAQYRAVRQELELRISKLREAAAKNALASSGLKEYPILNKQRLENAVQTKIGDTSWNILQLLADNPTISNREIAESLFLSEEGISSSLRRMYDIFDIQVSNSKNHKMALLSKAVELSVDA